MKTERILIALLFAAGIGLWGLAAVLDVAASPGRAFLDALILDLSGKTIFFRSLLTISFPTFGLILAAITARRRRDNDRIEHLNRVLRATRRIGQLIATEQSRDRLLQSACDALVETRGYYHAMIIPWGGDDGGGSFMTSLGAGHEPCLDVRRLAQEHAIHCWHDALGQAGLLVIEDTARDCGDCPRAGVYGDRGILVTRLEHGGHLYGVLSVALPRRLVADREEQSLFEEIAEDIAFGLRSIELAQEREQATQALQQQYHQLRDVNRIGQVLNSSLALDEVLHHTLEELRRLMNAAACSVWLIDSGTRELVCRQTSGANSEIMRGWRLGPGEGIASWVARTGKSLIVPDARFDERHFDGVDRQTGASMRSILTVPLRSKGRAIGVLQVLHTDSDRFGRTELALAESFATAGAIAIENARLYEHTNKLRKFNENIIQSMDEGIVIENAEGRITFVNRKTAQLLNYHADELKGQHVFTLLAPDQIDLVRGEAARRPQGIASRYESILLTRERQQIPVIISARPLFNGEQFAGVLSVLTDISERKRIQEERLRLEKLESIGLLAGGIAHDFNNLLTTILGNVEIARRHIKKDAPPFAALSTAEKSALRARDLTRQLLTFSKGETPIKAAVALPELLRDVSCLVTNGTNVQCICEIADDLRAVEADESQISQVIQNLALNAVQAMPEGGAIHVRADNIQVGADSSLPLLDGAYVRITVQDEGAGIPERLLPRVFDPYFTTKEGGTGLGLATSYSIVRKHEGHIAVESTPGIGSTFTVFLPALAGSTPAGPAAPLDSRAEQGAGAPPHHGPGPARRESHPAGARQPARNS
jgi:PAS domain S-box-containing protein